MIKLTVRKDDQGFYVVHNAIMWHQTDFCGNLLWFLKEGDIVDLVDGDGFTGRWIAVQHNNTTEDWFR